MSATKPSSRELLLDLGVGGFNVTMIVPYMMVAPATTDAKAGQIVVMVRALQRRLFQLGAIDVPDSGELDDPTAHAIEQLLGPNWLRMPWSVVIQAVNDAKRRGVKLRPMGTGIDDSVPIAVSGPLDFLPDVPGGLLTYAIGGYFVWKYLKRAR